MAKSAAAPRSASTPAGRQAVRKQSPARATRPPRQAPDQAADALPAQEPTTGDDGALSPRELRRRRRIQVGREQILDAAEELFGSQGYQATSLEQVAKSCEFSVGALYMFFNSKQELFEAVAQRRGPQQLAEMEACLTEELRGLDTLLLICRAVLNFHHNYPGFGRLSIRMFGPGMEALPQRTAMAHSFDRALDVYAVAIRRGQVDGSVRRGDPHQLARLVSALVTAHHLMDPQLTRVREGMPAGVLLEIIAAAMTPGPNDTDD